jgi:hypothetical protein
MARNRYVGTKMSLLRTSGSTVKIEPVGLSTRERVERRIVTVIGSWLRLPEQKGLVAHSSPPTVESSEWKRGHVCGLFVRRGCFASRRVDVQGIGLGLQGRLGTRAERAGQAPS